MSLFPWPFPTTEQVSERNTCPFLLHLRPESVWVCNLWGKLVVPLLENEDHSHRDYSMVTIWIFWGWGELNLEQALLFRVKFTSGFRLTSSYIFLLVSFIKDRMHHRKYVELHQSKWTVEYVERKPLSFTRSTTKRDGMRNQRGSQLRCLRIFFVCSSFSFWHLLYFWEASFTHLLPLI